MMIRELVMTLSFLSLPAAVAVIFGGVAAPLVGSGETSADRAVAAPAGADAYARACAACHGPAGLGTASAPALLGEDGVAWLPEPSLLHRMSGGHAPQLTPEALAETREALALLREMDADRGRD